MRAAQVPRYTVGKARRHMADMIMKSNRFDMASVKDVCGRCAAPISWQRFIVCSGTCVRSFHCECVNVPDASLLVKKGVSTFKCAL